MTSREAVPFRAEVKKLLAEVFGLNEAKRGAGNAGKKKLAVHSPFVWKNKGEF